jgi:hypothetical protein
VVEGRAREAIWREGRWWDEIAMSILDSDWAVRRGDRRDQTPETESPPATPVAESPPATPVPVGVGRSGLPE